MMEKRLLMRLLILLFLILNSVIGCSSDSNSGADTVSDTEMDTGSDIASASATENETAATGGDTGADSGSDTEVDTGSEMPLDTGGDTDWDTETDDGICTDICSAFTAADPIVGENGSAGSVTTYGSPDDPEYSVGGACNYGQTELQHYAAIHVHVSASANDFLGPWDDGRACGGCLRVRTRTAVGWKETIVRITDRCADEYCGVDLGGAPAAALMPRGPGRYEGEWEWVSCEGYPELFDGPTTVHVKDGANPYWSIIQVRNPLSQVTGISITKDGESEWLPLDYAFSDVQGEESYAENFYIVPKDVLQDDSEYTILIEYALADPQTVVVNGSDLAVAEADYPVTDVQSTIE